MEACFCIATTWCHTSPHPGFLHNSQILPSGANVGSTCAQGHDVDLYSTLTWTLLDDLRRQRSIRWPTPFLNEELTKTAWIGGIPLPPKSLCWEGATHKIQRRSECTMVSTSLSLSLSVSPCGTLQLCHVCALVLLCLTCHILWLWVACWHVRKHPLLIVGPCSYRRFCHKLPYDKSPAQRTWARYEKQQLLQRSPNPLKSEAVLGYYHAWFRIILWTPLNMLSLQTSAWRSCTAFHKEREA